MRNWIIAACMTLGFGLAGQAAELSDQIDLNQIDGINGAKISVPTDPKFVDVASIGDFNGDGLDDFALGLPLADPRGIEDSGQVYVVFGREIGFPSPFDASNLQGVTGFTIHGNLAGDQFGTSVSGAGDVNGDGYDDLIVGVPFADLGDREDVGVAYVIYGGSARDFPADVDLSAINGRNGFVLLGSRGVEVDDLGFHLSYGDQVGAVVRGAGDIDNDGFADLIVSGGNAQMTNDRERSVRAWVVYGSDQPFPRTITLSEMAEGIGTAFLHRGGIAFPSRTIAGNLDVNGDGIDDLLLGADIHQYLSRLIPSRGLFKPTGDVAVIFGQQERFGRYFDWDTIPDHQGGMYVNSSLGGGGPGRSLAALGDINGDGVDDFGDVEGDHGYVIYGSKHPLPTYLDLFDLDGSNGFVITDLRSEYENQPALSSAGDINGDGLGDILISEVGYLENRPDSKPAATVIYGRASGFPAQFSLGELTASQRLQITDNGAPDWFGYVGLGGVDANGDGNDDLLIGDYYGPDTAYLIHGVQSDLQPTTIYSSVLPAARSGFLGGDPITVFSSVINAGTNRADNCQFLVANSPPVTTSYQPTNSVNAGVGPADTAFSINPGETKSYILTFTPASTSTGEDIFPQVVCTNASVAAIRGVNTVFLSIDTEPVPDILSISATPSGDGIITVPANGISFMSASALNFGAGDSGGSADAAITVSVDDGGANLPLFLQVCETDSVGTCTSALGPNVATTIGAGPSFFGVFASDQASGGIALDPAVNRVFLRFTDVGGTVRSVTSAAVTVQ